MQDYLVWTTIGFALVIIELMTGTFYLLVIGVGALAAALAAWLGVPFFGQVATAGLVAGIGTWWVHHWHAGHRTDGDQGNAIDTGQAVTVASWVNQAEGTLRVKYRGTDWDARIKPGDVAASAAGVGDTLHILAQDGQCWVVGSQRPAA